MTGCGTVKSNLEGNRKNHTDAMLSDFGTVVTYFPGIPLAGLVFGGYGLAWGAGHMVGGATAYLTRKK